jgi:hypothetical protein
MLILFILLLLLPSVSAAQVALPNGLTCTDLIAYADSRPGARTPNPKDPYDQAQLQYATQLCRKLGRKEIDAREFNVLFKAKQDQLMAQKRSNQTLQQQPPAAQDPIQSQLDEAARRNKQLAIQAQRDAEIRRQQQAAIAAQQRAAIQAQQQAERAARQQLQQAQQGPLPLGSHDLARYCESLGMGVDYNRNTCVQMGGFSRGGGGVAVPDADLLMERCRATGRLPDYRKWACM